MIAVKKYKGFMKWDQLLEWKTEKLGSEPIEFAVVPMFVESIIFMSNYHRLINYFENYKRQIKGHNIVFLYEDGVWEACIHQNFVNLIESQVEQNESDYEEHN